MNNPGGPGLSLQSSPGCRSLLPGLSISTGEQDYLKIRGG